MAVIPYTIQMLINKLKSLQNLTDLCLRDRSESTVTDAVAVEDDPVGEGPVDLPKIRQRLHHQFLQIHASFLAHSLLGYRF